jgi:hypothetical protein
MRIKHACNKVNSEPKLFKKNNISSNNLHRLILDDIGVFPIFEAGLVVKGRLGLGVGFIPAPFFFTTT